MKWTWDINIKINYRCRETGKWIYTPEEWGTEVVNGIATMGYYSKHDLMTFEFYIEDGWYRYEYLDELIINGEARFLRDAFGKYEEEKKEDDLEI